MSAPTTTKTCNSSLCGGNNKMMSSSSPSADFGHGDDAVITIAKTTFASVVSSQFSPVQQSSVPGPDASSSASASSCRCGTSGNKLVEVDEHPLSPLSLHQELIAASMHKELLPNLSPCQFGEDFPTMFGAERLTMHAIQQQHEPTDNENIANKSQGETTNNDNIKLVAAAPTTNIDDVKLDSIKESTPPTNTVECTLEHQSSDDEAIKKVTANESVLVVVEKRPLLPVEVAVSSLPPPAIVQTVAADQKQLTEMADIQAAPVTPTMLQLHNIICSNHDINSGRRQCEGMGSRGDHSVVSEAAPTYSTCGGSVSSVCGIGTDTLNFSNSHSANINENSEKVVVGITPKPINSNTSGNITTTSSPIISATVNESTSSAGEQLNSMRRVSFPKHTNELVTGYLEPANPWATVRPVSTTDELVALYRESCHKHNDAPIESIIAHLKSLNLNQTLRASLLSLKDQHLTSNACEALEEIFKRVQYKTIDLSSCNLNDIAATAIFDMMEYYEATNELNISDNRDITSRGWLAGISMIKKSQALHTLISRGTLISDLTAANIGKSMNSVTSMLHTLKLEYCGLSGKPISSLCNNLKKNIILRELWLAHNDFTCNDAHSIALLLRANHFIQFLDVSNNNIQDSGVYHLTEALVEQARQLKKLPEDGAYAVKRHSEPMKMSLSLSDLSEALKTEASARRFPVAPPKEPVMPVMTSFSHVDHLDPALDDQSRIRATHEDDDIFKASPPAKQNLCGRSKLETLLHSQKQNEAAENVNNNLNKNNLEDVIVPQEKDDCGGFEKKKLSPTIEEMPSIVAEENLMPITKNEPQPPPIEMVPSVEVPATVIFEPVSRVIGHEVLPNVNTNADNNNLQEVETINEILNEKNLILFDEHNKTDTHQQQQNEEVFDINENNNTANNSITEVTTPVDDDFDLLKCNIKMKQNAKIDDDDDGFVISHGSSQVSLDEPSNVSDSSKVEIAVDVVEAKEFLPDDSCSESFSTSSLKMSTSIDSMIVSPVDKSNSIVEISHTKKKTVEFLDRPSSSLEILNEPKLEQQTKLSQSFDSQTLPTSPMPVSGDLKSFANSFSERSVSQESLNSEASVDSNDSKNSIKIAETKFTKYGTLERQQSVQSEVCSGRPPGGLQVLVMWNNHLTRESAPSISKLLEETNSLEMLNVGRNTLSNDFIKTVKNSLKKNTSLTNLGLQGVHLNCQSMKTLSEIIEFGGNSTLQRIDLRDNNLQAEGLGALDSALKSNKSVTRIDLDDVPRRAPENGSDADYSRLVTSIRAQCVRNENPPEMEPPRAAGIKRARTYLSNRKISLTCQSIRSAAAVDIGPTVTPVPSPSRSRFQVSRVSESTLSSSPQPPAASSCSPTSLFSGGSRFRVTPVGSSRLRQPPKAASLPKETFMPSSPVQSTMSSATPSHSIGDEKFVLPHQPISYGPCSPEAEEVKKYMMEDSSSSQSSADSCEPSIRNLSNNKNNSMSSIDSFDFLTTLSIPSESNNKLGCQLNNFSTSSESINSNTAKVFDSLSDTSSQDSLYGSQESPSQQHQLSSSICSTLPSNYPLQQSSLHPNDDTLTDENNKQLRPPEKRVRKTSWIGMGTPSVKSQDVQTTTGASYPHTLDKLLSIFQNPFTKEKEREKDKPDPLVASKKECSISNFFWPTKKDALTSTATVTSATAVPLEEIKTQIPIVPPQCDILSAQLPHSVIDSHTIHPEQQELLKENISPEHTITANTVISSQMRLPALMTTAPTPPSYASMLIAPLVFVPEEKVRFEVGGDDDDDDDNTHEEADTEDDSISSTTLMLSSNVDSSTTSSSSWIATSTNLHPHSAHSVEVRDSGGGITKVGGPIISSLGHIARDSLSKFKESSSTSQESFSENN